MLSDEIKKVSIDDKKLSQMKNFFLQLTLERKSEILSRFLQLNGVESNSFIHWQNNSIKKSSKKELKLRIWRIRSRGSITVSLEKKT